MCIELLILWEDGLTEIGIKEAIATTFLKAEY